MLTYGWRLFLPVASLGDIRCGSLQIFIDPMASIASIVSMAL